MPKHITFTASVIPESGGVNTVLVDAPDAEGAKLKLQRMGYRDVQVHDHTKPAENHTEASEVQPVETAKLLDALPGLVGAIDKAIIDQTSKRFPFVLLVFGNGAALHATNIDAKAALSAVQDFAAATAGDAS